MVDQLPVLADPAHSPVVVVARGGSEFESEMVEVARGVDRFSRGVGGGDTRG